MDGWIDGFELLSSYYYCSMCINIIFLKHWRVW